MFIINLYFVNKFGFRGFQTWKGLNGRTSSDGDLPQPSEQFGRLCNMEKGNEGDEIILLSLRQIECSIPNEIVKVGQITADLLVEIIARSLMLISDGEVKVTACL